MDMYQKRKMRAENKKNDMEKSSTNVSINWYPGHMAKARREISEAAKQVDVIIEIIDARIPKSSRNPILNEIIGNKPRVVILNKADLADDNKTAQWAKKIKDNNQVAIIANSNQGDGIQSAVNASLELMKEKIDNQVQKGRTGISIKVMVVGIPNVGKSTFINKVAKKQTAEVSNKPGVTKKNQWIRLNDKVQLLDTPGVLWPKLDNEEVARHLAYIGSIKDEIIDVEELAINILKELYKLYKNNLYERYKISADFEFEEIIELMEEIGQKRGCLVKGGEVDYTKAANIILDDFRTGKIGKITLEE